MVSVCDLYNELIDNGILLFDYKQNGSPAATVCIDGACGVFLDTRVLNTVEKEKTVVAHECGHCFTGATHTVYSSYDIIEKHEYKANKWAAHRLIPPDELAQALRDGYTEIWQLADYFGVTEDFINKTLSIYRSEEIGIFRCLKVNLF